MAFRAESLSALTYANGFTMWHYRTDDSATTVDGAGYFSGAVKMLRVGDFVFANTDLDGTPASGVFVVRSNDGTTVDVANLVGFDPSNSD